MFIKGKLSRKSCHNHLRIPNHEGFLPPPKPHAVCALFALHKVILVLTYHTTSTVYMQSYVFKHFTSMYKQEKEWDWWEGASVHWGFTLQNKEKTQKSVCRGSLAGSKMPHCHRRLSSGASGAIHPPIFKQGNNFFCNKLGSLHSSQKQWSYPSSFYELQF